MVDTAFWGETEQEAKGQTVVSFFDHHEHIEPKSIEAGYPVYEQKVYIHKWMPADTKVEIIREKRDGEESEYPKAWQAYLEKRQVVAEGTPIDEWPKLTAGQAQMFKTLNLHTIEQLAKAPETVAPQVMGFYEFQKAARNFIKNKQKNNANQFLQKELAKRDQTVNELNAKLQDLTNKFEEMGQPSLKGKNKKKEKVDVDDTPTADTRNS